LEKEEIMESTNEPIAVAISVSPISSEGIY
jgi:hypothetical protein